MGVVEVICVNCKSKNKYDPIYFSENNPAKCSNCGKNYDYIEKNNMEDVVRDLLSRIEDLECRIDTLENGFGNHQHDSDGFASHNY